MENIRPEGNSGQCAAKRKSTMTRLATNVIICPEICIPQTRRQAGVAARRTEAPLRPLRQHLSSSRPSGWRWKAERQISGKSWAQTFCPRVSSCNLAHEPILLKMCIPAPLSTSLPPAHACLCLWAVAKKKTRLLASVYFPSWRVLFNALDGGCASETARQRGMKCQYPARQTSALQSLALEPAAGSEWGGVGEWDGIIILFPALHGFYNSDRERCRVILIRNGFFSI